MIICQRTDVNEMSGDHSLDPRSVCNLLLDEAANRHPITHIDLQKLLYFAHGLYLVETKRPLVSGYFEAWQFGPVHPTAYVAFKVAGSRPIDFRAVRRDALTGETSPLSPPTCARVVDCIRRIVLAYGRLDTHRLVELSHAPKAPWHFVVDKARTSLAFGMRIPDDVILERFRYHKVSVGPRAEKGEVYEDAPFAGN